jgi:cysteine synthase
MAATAPSRTGVLSLIGNTPVIPLQRVTPPGITILAKAEFLNPAGSVKDRMARYIVERAEQRGELRPDSTIIEVTSGNTGIAFAMVGAEKGYRVRIMMPESASIERRHLITCYGAELELIDGQQRINDARREAEDRASRDRRIYLPRQFSNPLNAEAHRETTGPEIIAQAGTDIDAFVMGVGTGGTLMGVGEALRRVNRRVQLVAVEPAESAVLSGDKPGTHGIQGLADGFIPEIVDLGRIDRVIKIKTEDAIRMAMRLAREEALFVGISSGANVLAAIQLAEQLGPDKKIVTVLPDRGERYLSVWQQHQSAEKVSKPSSRA